MGSPKTIQAEVDPAGVILGELEAVKLPPLEPSVFFEVLEKVVRKLKPQFRNLFHNSFQDLHGGLWSRLEEKPSLPRGLNPRTKCEWVLGDEYITKLTHHIVITRNGRVFLWVHDNRGEKFAQTITPLTEDVFTKTWPGRHSQVVGAVMRRLEGCVNSSMDDLNSRLRWLRGAAPWLIHSLYRLPES